MTDHLRPPPPGWHVIPDPPNAIVGCDRCGHVRGEHSREPGVGCLHVYGMSVTLREPIPITCPCTEPGTSQADQ